MLAKRIRLRGNESLSDAVLDSLGVLERKVMFVVYESPEMSVGQVNAAFGEIYAYTTVMTTLDRLFKKGLLNRRKDGRAYLYSARFSIEELEQGVARDVIGHLLDRISGRVEPVLACIVDSVSDRDAELLDELERLVRDKRQAINGGKIG